MMKNIKVLQPIPLTKRISYYVSFSLVTIAAVMIVIGAIISDPAIPEYKSVHIKSMFFVFLIVVAVSHYVLGLIFLKTKWIFKLIVPFATAIVQLGCMGLVIWVRSMFFAMLHSVILLYFVFILLPIVIPWETAYRILKIKNTEENMNNKETELETQNNLPPVRKRGIAKNLSLLFIILIFNNLSFSQEIKKVVYKEGYNYIPISYLTDTTTVGILHSLIIDEKGWIRSNDEKTFVFFWYSMCTDGRYDLTITPEQIYLTSGHENPTPNILFWIFPIDSIIYQYILNGFQKNNMKKSYFDSSYNEEKLLPIKIESIENEEYETWDYDNCDSLLEMQVDKFFLIMNEFIPNKNQKLDKIKCIIPQNPIFYSFSTQALESWKNYLIETKISDE